jgi:DNA ligase-associated metallophosphoesterase
MTIAHQWLGQTFWLSGQRAMYWEDAQTLIASDLHLGKGGHFRKSGIALPQQMMKHDLMRLFDLLQHFKPKTLLVVGDMFHSEANKELDWFSRWRNDMAQLNITLVKGNHDILHKDWYHQNGIELQDTWQQSNIHFVHDPAELSIKPGAGTGFISGHIHPGIRISGIGRQTLRFPCFYFSKQQCILPAFGLFTGTFALKPKKADVVYAIADQKIISLS